MASHRLSLKQGAQRVDQIQSFTRYLLNTSNRQRGSSSKQNRQNLCSYGTYILLQELIFFLKIYEYIVHKMAKNGEENKARKGSQQGERWRTGELWFYVKWPL